VHYRESTIFFVELLEEFPRLTRAKLHLKIKDNRLHSNGKVKHRDQRGDFQQSCLLLQLKCDLLVGDQNRIARNREDAAQRLQKFVRLELSFEAIFHRRFTVLALNVSGLRHRSKVISVFSRLMKDICDLN
jgi:hypothetical protein